MNQEFIESIVIIAGSFTTIPFFFLSNQNVAEQIS
jgi:hypothetical protein